MIRHLPKFYFERKVIIWHKRVETNLGYGIDNLKLKTLIYGNGGDT